MHHALDCDMMEWVFNKPDVAPAFVLARAGYDVWMGNNRGNRFSRKHKTLSPKQKEFWDYDWEDMGLRDTPDAVEYILNITGLEKINYIGHSEGTTQIMAGAALNPEWYKKRMNVAVLLAPPAAMYYNDSKLIRWASSPPIRNVLEKLFDAIHLYDFLPQYALFTHAAVFLCDVFNHKLCDNFLSVIMNKDPSTDYPDRFDVYASNVPSGASTKDFWHYAQFFQAKTPTFNRYDYGSDELNMNKYNQTTPPDYDLSLLDFPIAIFGG